MSLWTKTKTLREWDTELMRSSIDTYNYLQLKETLKFVAVEDIKQTLQEKRKTLEANQKVHNEEEISEFLYGEDDQGDIFSVATEYGKLLMLKELLGEKTP